METERAIRRNVANLNERRRMHSINDGFDVLRNYLPGQGRENLSKVGNQKFINFSKELNIVIIPM